MPGPALAEMGFDPKHILKNTRQFTPQEWVMPIPDTRVSPLPPRGTIVDLINRDKEQVRQKEYFYSKEWVQEEVAKVKQKPIRKGETPWWHLRGTGFWVREQIAQLVRNLKNIGKEALPDVLDLELSKVGEDFAHFEQEYLRQMATLKWNLAWQNRDGVKRVVCPDYKGGGKNKEGALWSSVTSKDERDGIVFSTLFGTDEEEKTGTGGVEGWLKTARPGSFAFIVSPEGWSGYDNIRYPEAQCYGIEVLPDGSLRAHTFRYTATIDQTEALQRDLGREIPKATSSHERIKNTVANVALLTPEDARRLNMHGFEDFVNLMQKSVGGREIAYGEGGAVKTFDEIRKYIQDPDQFIKKHAMTDKLNERFLEYAKWRLAQGGRWDVVEMDLQIAIAFNALQLDQAYRMQDEVKKKDVSGNEIFAYAGTPAHYGGQDFESALIMRVQQVDHSQQKDALAQRAGCAGGGQNNGGGRYSVSSQYVLSMGAHRLIQKAIEGKGKKESEEDKPEWFSCSECGWQASGAIGDNPCGGCGFTKEEYKKKYGLAC